MSLLMGVTLSFFMSLTGTLTSGHFTVMSWLIGFGISLVISIVIGLIVPMPKIEAAANGKLGNPPGTVKYNLVSALISNTIYTPVMSILMTVIMVTASAAGLQKQIDETAAQMTSVQSELAQLGDTDPQKTGELRARLGELEGRKSGMEAGKPNLGMAILVSLLVTYPVGYVIIVIVQPLFLGMLLKKYGPSRGGPGGPPPGAPGGDPPERDKQ